MNKFSLIGTIFLLSVNTFAEGMLTYGQYQRINTPADSEVDNGFYQFDVSRKKDLIGWSYSYNGSLRLYNEDRGLLFSVPELYTRYKSENNEVTLGRKVNNWSPTDKFWSMGEINPLKNFSLLENQREGLTGLYLKRRNGRATCEVFASYLHIPQLNPSFTADGDEVKGVNEWSNLPPQIVRFRGEDIPVNYDVIYPNVQDFVAQPAGSVNCEFSFNHHTFRSYGGKKPENSIRIVATGYYDQADGGKAFVIAKPFVNHHTFLGSSYTAYFKSKKERELDGTSGSSLSFAYDAIIPDRGIDTAFDTFESLKIQPVYERVSYATATYQYEGASINFGLNALFLIEGGSDDTNVFSKKPRWNRAVGFNMGWQPTDKLAFSVDYKFDHKNRDMTFLSSVDYQLFKHVGLGLEAQIVNSPSENSFWTPYRSNDSLLAKGSYQF